MVNTEPLPEQVPRTQYPLRTIAHWDVPSRDAHTQGPHGEPDV